MERPNEPGMSERLAHYEIEAWKAHHRRDSTKLIKNLTMLISLEYFLSREDAEELAKHWCLAAKHHDEAERCEDNHDFEEADRCWKEAEEDLVKYHTELSKKKSFA